MELAHWAEQEAEAGMSNMRCGTPVTADAGAAPCAGYRAALGLSGSVIIEWGLSLAASA